MSTPSLGFNSLEDEFDVFLLEYEVHLIDP